jgi:hypothetical protein
MHDVTAKQSARPRLSPPRTRSGDRILPRNTHRQPILRFPHAAKNGLGDENNQICSVTDTTVVVWIEVVEGLISDSVAPRRFAYASVAVDSRTVG